MHVCAYFLVFLVRNVILSVYTDDVVQWLSAGVAHSVASALADSTKGQYRGAEEIFILFCLFMRGSQQFLPVSDELLSLYLQWRSLTVDPKNLNSGLSAVRYLHERLGYSWRSVTERFRVHRCLMGLKRLCCTPVQQKLPITPAILTRMRRCKAIDWAHPWMVVIWAAMLVAFSASFGKTTSLSRRGTPTTTDNIWLVVTCALTPHLCNSRFVTPRPTNLVCVCTKQLHWPCLDVCWTHTMR